MPDRSIDVHQLIRLGRAEGVASSPNGTWLAVAVSRLDAKGAKYVSDLWRVGLDGSAPIQLTRGDWSDGSPSFRRDGALGFLSDRPRKAGDDDERAQVWLLPAQGEPRPLTDEPLGVSGFAFARGADRLVCVVPLVPGVALDAMREAEKDRKENGPSVLRYDRMPVRFWDHWIPRSEPHLVAFDGEGAGRVDLTPEPGDALRDLSWDLAEDGGFLVSSWTRHGAVDRIPDVGLVRIDLDGTRTVLRDEPRASYGSPRISPDGQWVAVERDVRRDGVCVSQQLWRLDARDGSGAALATGWDRWPHPVGWTRDGQGVVVTADDEGDVPVFVVEAGGVRRLTPGPGSHAAVVVGDGTIAGLKHSLRHPPEPFAADLSGHVTALGQVSGCPELPFTVERQAAGDVAYFVVRRAGSTGREPVLLWIHGGPIGAWGDGWSWRWCALVAAAAGYTVVLPNPRGSIGYGQAFVAGIWGNVWGEQCYRDVMAVADAVAGRDDVDPARMCAMGGSFGGYMTNWIGGQTDRFTCLVTHAALFDLNAFYGVTDLPAWWSFQAGTQPYGDRDEHERYSPHRFVTDWKSPTLILHGEKDYRVPVGEALALFEALQLHGVDSELAVFSDENHWILKPRNIIAWYETVETFLARKL